MERRGVGQALGENERNHLAVMKTQPAVMREDDGFQEVLQAGQQEQQEMIDVDQLRVFGPSARPASNASISQQPAMPQPPAYQPAARAAPAKLVIKNNTRIIRNATIDRSGVVETISNTGGGEMHLVGNTVVTEGHNREKFEQNNVSNIRSNQGAGKVEIKNNKTTLTIAQGQEFKESDVKRGIVVKGDTEVEYSGNKDIRKNVSGVEEHNDERIEA